MRPPSTQLLSLASPPHHQSSAHKGYGTSHLPDEPYASNGIIITPVSAFPRFPELPLELRIKIWRIALPYRLVTITPRLDPIDFTGEVDVATKKVELRSVCRESRREALIGYTQITFNDENHTSTYINWTRDTLFLDLPDECMNVNEIISVLGTAFRAVQVLAIRIKAHCFWGLPEFLRRSNQLQKLIFVDDPERPPLLDNINANLYLIDLGTWGFVRGCIIDFNEGHQYFQEGTWIRLMGSNEDELFGIRRWEMPLEEISLVKNLIGSGGRYFLLLPLN
jgi:hypothetical protein